LFWPLLVGAGLVLARPGGHREPEYLVGVIERERVTTVHFVPSMLAVFLQGLPAGRCAGLRRVICSGEALSGELVGEFYRRLVGVALHNLYGPTETAVDVTFRECGPGDATSVVPIGRPVANTRVFVLDEFLRPAPVGVLGELYVAGVQLAQGYLGRAGLTAERFVACPFDSGQRMYRTGDMARWTLEGEVVFTGRVDDQVKIRGLRVEPGEIEAVLAGHESVGQVVVVVREDRSGDKRLVAYAVAAEGHDVDSGALREFAAGRLPDYMVPAAVVALDELPVTANGKLDRARLPIPDFAQRATGREPATPAEEALSALFAEILELDRVGADDSFFDLGGDSLMAMRLLARIKTALGAKVSIRELYSTPTPEGIARALDSDDRDDFAVLLPLRTEGDQPPLFCIHPADGLGWRYAEFARSIPEGVPLYALQARGLVGDEPIPESIDEMAADYAARIREVQPAGPYHLLGWSLGGVVAHAIATHLQAEGERVDLLASLDGYPRLLMSGPAGPGAGNDGQRRVLEQGPGGQDRVEEELNELLGLSRTGDGPPDAVREQLEGIRKVMLNNMEVSNSFTPTTFRGNLLIFVATLGRSSRLPAAQAADAWVPYVDGDVRSYPVDCTHRDIVRPPFASEVGRVIAGALAELADGAREE
jgi:enterobactin synthetase component F